MTERPQWNSFRALSRRVLWNGEPLVLTEEVRSLLLKTAQEVAIRDADAALATDEGALALMHEATRRITEGSNRLTDALHVMWQHQRVGDYDSAEAHA
ncbi:hypothetical protein LILAB_11710 [Corallococcus macrosporus]|uniref:DUSAM domain-containing protein n=1 Tax=Myxococcus fulvus (strain ATCC BAA-855 / HW-1) TaxID=483219 RepID=F8CRA7_MYXFH|nr:hypothetical protein LILAB_11710 [Corallococcus macrosporus]